MRIAYRRSGGFGGFQTGVTLESDSMPYEESEELRRLVERAKFFDLPARIIEPEGGADRFHYEITIETESGRHSVETVDGSVPSELQPLIDWLNRASRKARRRNP